MKCFFASLLIVASAFAAETNQESRFLSNTRQLTFEGRRSGEGYFSPDGRALVFQSERDPENPFYQIFLLDLESGDTHRVSPGIGKTTCAFFRPGSDNVLFASTHLDPSARAKQKAELNFRASGKERRYSWDYDEQMDIFVARRDGSNVRRLTSETGYDAEGAFSPDGASIVFCSLRAAYPSNKLSAADLKRLETDPSYFGDVYLMNADASSVRRLTEEPGYDGGPFFSPDGRRIAWRHFNTNGVIADVFTMRPDGSDKRRVTDFACMSWAPYFHPSGRYLIFTANKLGFGNFELFLADANGERKPVRVTFTDGFDGLPVFSPDGKKLAWTSARTSDGKSQLFIADWNHAAALVDLSGAPPLSAIAATKSVGATSFSPARLSNDVAYLASEELEGRFTGSQGAELAAEFLAQRLSAAGLQPRGDSNTFFQQFEFNSGVRVITNGNVLSVQRDNGASHFAVEKDFRPLAFSDNGTVEGEIVFAGYGLSVPGKAGESYDSYAGLNVSNKIVLALRYVPEDVEPKRRQELNRYAGLRYKAMLARERGAKAIVFVTGPNSPNAGELIPIEYDNSTAGSGIIAVSVTSNIVAQLLASTGRDLKQFQSALDNENPHAQGGFGLTNIHVKITTALERLKKSDRNVLAYLPPQRVPGILPGSGVQPGETPGARSETILVGAHYDHLGYGESGAMLRAGEEKKIHFGADDNASGTAVVLALAEQLARERATNANAFTRGILFAFWSGEEEGVIGSSQFAEHPVVPLSNIIACVNFDMVGRLRENKLMLQGAGSSPAWKRLIEKRNVAAGFNAVLQDDPYLPTDVTAFYPRGIAVLNFFTGSHDDYHRPTDTPEKLNYEGMERIAKFARGLLLDLASTNARPEYAKVTSTQTGGGRDSLRAYLGTIPDYASEVQGVKFSGVRAGSPAEKAGLKGGDVLVEFAGQKIANIYDYTYALDAAKIGQSVKLAVMREGQRVTVSVTPEARK
jgi:Tol biopolymer transport system component